MRITVEHTTATAADIAGWQPLQPMRAPVTQGHREIVIVRRPDAAPPMPRRRPTVRYRQARTAAGSLGDTAVVTVVRPARHSVGGGPRARPAVAY